MTTEVSIPSIAQSAPAHAGAAAQASSLTLTSSPPSGRFPAEVDPGPDLASQTTALKTSWFDSIFIVGQLHAAGHDFGYEVHVLQQPDDDLRHQVIAVTDSTSGWFKSDGANLAADELQWDDQSLQLYTPQVSWTGDLEHQKITATTPWGALDLDLEPQGPVLYYAGTGSFALLGARQFQYALPRMRTTGTLTADGRAWEVTGDSWLDRQWGAMPGLRTNRWTWMNMTLSNGDAIALWDAGSVDGTTARESWATVLHPDGTHELVPVTPLAEGASRHWHSLRGSYVFPTQWTVAIPSRQATLTVTATVLEQEVPGLGPTSAYEGAATVSGTYQGEQVDGRTYIEQVGNWSA